MLDNLFSWSQSKGLRYRTTDYCKANLAYLVFLEAVNHVGVAGRASSNIPLPPLALAWLPSNETLPVKLPSLLSNENAPVVVIDPIKDTKDELICGKHPPSIGIAKEEPENAFSRPLFVHARVL